MKRRGFLGLLGAALVAPIAARFAPKLPTVLGVDLAAPGTEMSGMAILARQHTAAYAMAVRVDSIRAIARQRLADHLAQRYDEMILQSLMGEPMPPPLPPYTGERKPGMMW